MGIFRTLVYGEWTRHIPHKAASIPLGTACPFARVHVEIQTAGDLLEPRLRMCGRAPSIHTRHNGLMLHKQ
jgi:hypothetical protein